ncbi:MAG: hypothetical protein ACFN3H_04800, partial [Spirochaetales bacterium]
MPKEDKPKATLIKQTRTVEQVPASLNRVPDAPAEKKKIVIIKKKPVVVVKTQPAPEATAELKPQSAENVQKPIAKAE